MASKNVFNVYKKSGNERKKAKIDNNFINICHNKQKESNTSDVVNDDLSNANVKPKCSIKKEMESNTKIKTRSTTFEATKFSYCDANKTLHNQNSKCVISELETMNNTCNDHRETNITNNVVKVVVENLLDVAITKNMSPNEKCSSSSSSDEKNTPKFRLECNHLDVIQNPNEIEITNKAKYYLDNKTELEREMEIYEAFEKDEEARLIIRDSHEMLKVESMIVINPPNEKKRICRGNLYEHKRKRIKHEQKLVTNIKNEEDVCFICFDGGDLTLCDRRSCPKAYHLGCIGRDKAFFIKKGAWFCGWHFCSNCKKNGNYQCYTCPTSYCENCVKQSEFCILHKKKGLCEDCLPIVSMIEHNETINNDGVHVDFEDKETYEYLFKDYWLELKNKFFIMISTTKNRGIELKDCDNHDLKIPNIFDSDKSDGDFSKASQGSHNSFKNSLKSEACPNEIINLQETSKSNSYDNFLKTKSIATSKFVDYKILQTPNHTFNEEKGESCKQLPTTIEGWASKELKAFLENMKEDTNKPLTRFVVHKLLWMYIKKRKLQNPRKMSDIICDKQLRLIFEKDSVGQFEMFKLLNKHFPNRTISKCSKKTIITSDEQKLDDILSSNTTNQDKLKYSMLKIKRKGRKTEEKFQRPDNNEYAAINYKNISLIYLRRSILEEFINDLNFEDKVVGTFVKIRVPGNSKMDSCYRLVLIIGIGLQKESYLAGSTMTNVTLSILNLQKREYITIDVVSNQDFTQEECERLRLNIKCGFLRTFTVGQLEEKAISLQETKVNDWMENERQRLINLRDRASEKGRKKELRECVERLQELNNPIFRAEKVKARLEIIADPHMNPIYDSDDGGDGGESDSLIEKCCPSEVFQSQKENSYSSRTSWRSNCMDDYKQRYGSNNQVSSSSKDDEINRRISNWRLNVTTSCTPSILKSSMATNCKIQVEEAKLCCHDVRENGLPLEKDIKSTNELKDTSKKTIDKHDPCGHRDQRTTNSMTLKINNKTLVDPNAKTLESVVFSTSNHIKHHIGMVPLTVVSTIPVNLYNPIEQKKLWHYVDPFGTIQGPFSIEQLRKWNETGLFPIDLRIWKSTEDQKHSILLTDGLQGRSKIEIDQCLMVEEKNDKNQILNSTTPSNTKYNKVEFAQESDHVMVSIQKQEIIKSNGLIQSCQPIDIHVNNHEQKNYLHKEGNNKVFSIEAHSTASKRLEDPSCFQKDELWVSNLLIGETSICDGQNNCFDVAKPSWINQVGKEVYRVERCNISKDKNQSLKVQIDSKKPCKFYIQGYCWKGKACGYWHK